MQKVVVAGFDYYLWESRHCFNGSVIGLCGRFDIVQINKSYRETISSTLIRQYIKNGEIDKANAMLGYSYETLGFVIHGDART